MLLFQLEVHQIRGGQVLLLRDGQILVAVATTLAKAKKRLEPDRLIYRVTKRIPFSISHADIVGVIWYGVSMGYFALDSSWNVKLLKYGRSLLNQK